MRQDQATYRNNASIKNSWRVERFVDYLKIMGCLVGFFLAFLQAEDASAHTTVEVEPRTGVHAALSRTNSQAVELYAPEDWRTKQSKPEIILAHAIIVKTSPPQGGVTQGNIGKVDVWYDAGIRDSLAALAVVSAAGERIDKRDAAIDTADPAHVSVSVNPMIPGKYTVRYRALSADGHMVSGAWEFDVQP
jgi:methionine-rich copper-binding protein CopC